jgi:hypothetical protein
MGKDRNDLSPSQVQSLLANGPKKAMIRWNLFTYFFLFYDLLVEMKKVKKEKMERKLMKEQKQKKTLS